jgi:hypothetical protein
MGGGGGDGGYGGDADAGGVSTGAGSLTLQNCTVAFNSTAAGAGGAAGMGGSGIAGTFGPGVAGAPGADRGGGLVPGGTASLFSTIVSDNSASAGPDVYGSVTVTASLIEDVSGATMTGTPMTGDPALGGLADNGGPTRTHAIAAASLAYNAGANPAGLATDQRGNGFARVRDGAADIGAFELQAGGGGGPGPGPGAGGSNGGGSGGGGGCAAYEHRGWAAWVLALLSVALCFGRARRAR